MKPIVLLKRVIFAAALIPAAMLLVDAFTGRLTANPIDFITDTTGDWAIRFVIITLCVTPVIYLYMELFQEKVLNRIPFLATHYEGHGQAAQLERPHEHTEQAPADRHGESVAAITMRLFADKS